MKKTVLVLICVLSIFTSACKSQKADRLAEGSVRFTAENLPKIAVTELTKDNGTGLAAAILGVTQSEASTLITVCETTDDCYAMLISGECDIVIAHPYGKSVKELLAATPLEFTEASLYSDALVFVTNGGSAPDTLSTEQLRALYSGETSNWQEVGGSDTEVTLFGEKSKTAVQNAFEKYISEDITVPDVQKTIETADGSYTATVGYDNRNGAVGYTLFKAAEGFGGGSVKPIAVDGVLPSEETVKSGEYKLQVPVNVVIRASEPAGQNVRVLYEWIISEQGRAASGCR